MNDGDGHTDIVSADVRVEKLNLKASVKSRAVSVFLDLLGHLIGVSKTTLEEYSNKIQAKNRLEVVATDAIAARLEKTIQGKDFEIPLVEEMARNRIQSLVNKRSVVEKALYYLKEWAGSGSKEQPADEPAEETAEINPDWINYFGEHAAKATTDYMRDRWGKILAGEITQPGSFSLTTLRILAEIDQRTATWFAEETRFRINGSYILLPKEYGHELTKRLSTLEEIGLLHHMNPNDGLKTKFTPENGFAAVEEGGLCLRIHTESEIQLKIIGLTTAGREIAGILLSPVNPMSVFEKLAEAVQESATSVDVCKTVAIHGDHIFMEKPPLKTFF